MSGAFQTACIELPSHSAQHRAMDARLNANFTVALVVLCAAAAGQDHSQPTDPALTILVHDYSGLSPAILHDVESQTRLLLSHARLSLEWVLCTGTANVVLPEPCNANLAPGRFTLRILATYPGNQNKRGDPLGSAEIEGLYASLYAGEIRKSADRHGVSLACLMAYAAVHEIGHLLLGPQHSPAGLMQAVWDKAAYRDMAQRWLAFGALESDAMRQAAVQD